MSVARSPSPKSPRRGLRIVLIIIAVLAVLSIAIAAAIPLLVIPWAEDEVQRRLQARLRTSLTIETTTLSWGRVTLNDVEFGGRDGEPSFAFDFIDVELDRDALWEAQVEVVAVAVERGEVRGTVTEFEDFVRRLREGRRPGTSAKTGRIRLRPKRIDVNDVAFDLTRREGKEPPMHATLVLSAKLDVEGSTVALTATDVRGEDGGVLKGQARSISAMLAADQTDEGYALRFPVRAEVRGAQAPLSEAISLAGVDGWVEVSDAGATQISLDVEGAFGDAESAPEEKLWSIAGRVQRDLSEGVLRVDMDDFDVARVPAEVRQQLPLVNADRATVGGHLAVVFGEGVAAMEGDLAVDHLSVRSATLGRRAIEDVGVELSFAAEVDPQARSAVLHYVDLTRNGVTLSASATIEHPPLKRGRRYDVVFEVPKVSCQAVLDAVPEGFAPSLEGFSLGGNFEASVTTHVDFADLDTLSLGGTVDMEHCEVLATPPHADVERLAGGFTHRVLMKDGATVSVQMYPGARGFASIRQISPYVTAAIRSTEDGGFWKHNGFMPSQFEVAMRRNLAAGKVRLGASTITMQMVKNVLLGHERTLSRKFQEMFLTWYVEHVLSKDRIMELYLNAIEYGPGIYGIVDAASYYFGKQPAQLDPPEAVFLALMLPSPVRRSVYYCNGELSPRFAVKVQRILAIMNQRGRLSDLEYEVWKDAEVVFDLRRRGSERSCHGRIKSMLAGTVTQMPLSGLLSSDALLDDPPPEPAVESEIDFDLDPADDLDDLGDLDHLPGSADPSEVDDRGVPAMDG